MSIAAASRLLLIVLLIGLAAGAPAATRTSPARPASTVRLSGVEYVDLVELCARFGLKRVGTSTRQAVFKSEWSTLEFETESRTHEFNGVRVYTGEAVRNYRGRLLISQVDAEKLVTPILRPGTNMARVPSLKTIVIDPGHGGNDPGKVNARVKVMEKDMALDTARRAKTLLEAEGYRVVLTRADDRYVDLPERAEIASRHQADLFISIHFNAVEAKSTQVAGIEVYSLTPQYQYSTADSMREDDGVAKSASLGNRFDHWNVAASYAMHREMIHKVKAPDRGLKRARWKVLVLAPCPATYVEAGFLSNDVEARKIAQPAYRQKLAEGITSGVRAYAATLAQLRARS